MARSNHPAPRPGDALRVPHRRGGNNSIHVYQPASEMRRPLRLMRAMGTDLVGSRELAWQLAKRDISSQYRESFLGVAWALIPPIVAAAGLSFAAGADVINISETDIPYPAYVLLSMTLWQTFVEAITLPLGKVSEARAMLAKIQFPREALILSATAQVFFNFLLKLLLIAGMFLFFRLSVPMTIFLAPVALVHLVLLGIILGTFMAPLNALYQDFQRGIQILTTVWLLLTPVIYPIPAREGVFGILVNINPVTPLLVTTRELITTGNISNPLGFWVVSTAVFVALPIAWVVYRLAMPYAIERFSS
jgi:lipopolysaccharide transport system permease protein